MDPVALGFIVVLGVEAAVIAGLVGYLLFRPSDKKKKPQLQPEEKVTTAYGEPINENGHALLDVKDQPQDTTSHVSSISSDFKKPLELDSISIEIEKSPLYNDPPPTVIQMDREPAPDAEPDSPAPVQNKVDSSLNSSEDEKDVVDEPINESVALVSQEPQQRPSSSSSSSEDEKHEVEEPAIAAVNARQNEKETEDPFQLFSKEEDEKPNDEEEKLKSYSSPEEDEKRLIEEPMVDVVCRTDNEEQGKTLSSSTSSSEIEDQPVTSQRPVPVKRSKVVKKSFKRESVTSSTSSSDESDSNTKLTKVKKKKVKRVSTTSSSSDEQIINHKKKTHRKRYIHNIEEVEIIEEHTFNKTHKTIYKKAPPEQEHPEVSSESAKEDAAPPVYVSKVKRVKRRSKKIPPSIPSSSEEEEESEKDKKYHTEYRFDVSKNKVDDDEKHVTATTLYTSLSSPTKQVTKHRTYTETIQEDKTKKLEMCMSGSHSSGSDSEKRMRSVKTIPIVSSPQFQPITRTFATEKKERELEICISGSHSSESDPEARMISEKKILVSSSPQLVQFTKTFHLEKNEQEKMESSSSSSSSSESDSEARRMRSETSISLKPPSYETITTTVIVKEEQSPELNKSSSSSSESDEDVRMSSSARIQLMSPPKREVFSPTVVTATTTVPMAFSSDSSSDEKEIELSLPKDVSSSSSSSSEEEVIATQGLQSAAVSTLVNTANRDIKNEEESISKTTVSMEYNEFSNRAAVDENVTQTSTYTVESEVGKTLEHDPNVSSTSMQTEEVDFGKEVAVNDDKSKTTITTEEIVVMTTTREKKKKSRKDFQFTSGWQRQVSLADLFQAGVVSEATIEQLEEGTIEQEEVEKSLRVYLVGEEPIAGLIMSDTGEKVSIYDAWKKGLIRRGTSISLLEAQAATGRIINPKTAEKMSVNDATNKRLIDRQFEAVLVRAERAVYGYKTRLSNETLSLFEAMKREIVVENHGVRLLEAQIATGGIVDPNANHRLPVEVAYQRGLFDKRLNDILEDPSDDTRGFFDPNTEENLTYLELMERCVIDKDTGLRLLPFRSKQKKQAKTSKVVFESATKRQVLLQDIVNAELLDKRTARRFDEGQMTTEEVKEMVAQLKVYVDGNFPIAGVINSQTGEKMSFYEACRSGLIHKGTAFELLEAQAACGKLMDVQTGKPVSIETALRSGVIDSEFEDVVTRASRAVTGYREPFKREVLSLCEAMMRRIVVDRHAIRLLEAQIATGGIVDMKSPVRIKVNVAVKRGLLDRILAQKLESRETASYFDPVTGENLNYSELMGRCVLDKDTNLLFLMLEGGTVTGNIRPFEPEQESMKIRDKSHTKLTTEVVRTKVKKRRSSKKERALSPPPESVPSSPPAILSRRVVIVDPNSGKELTVREALKHKLIDKDTAKQLMAQEGDFDDAEENL